ncbi:MAG: hypothetical protein ACM3O7_06875 [Acidobacteriota bacterium]
MNLNVTPAERELLEGMLATSLGTLREEVYHAEEARFKDELKAEEEQVRTLLGKVKALAPAA